MTKSVQKSSVGKDTDSVTATKTLEGLAQDAPITEGPPSEEVKAEASDSAIDPKRAEKDVSLK